MMKDLPKKSLNYVLVLIFCTVFCVSLCITMSIEINLTEPRFFLQRATVHNFNLTGAAGNRLTTNITVAVAARIPYKRRGIYYDRLNVYAVYKNKTITLPAPLPASYQSYENVAVWSAFLSGDSVAVGPSVGMEVREKVKNGMVLVNIIVEGLIRKHFWNVEIGPCRLYAKCPAYLSFGSSISGKYLVQSCHVEVHDF